MYDGLSNIAVTEYECIIRILQVYKVPFGGSRESIYLSFVALCSILFRLIAIRTKSNEEAYFANYFLTSYLIHKDLYLGR